MLLDLTWTSGACDRRSQESDSTSADWQKHTLAYGLSVSRCERWAPLVWGQSGLVLESSGVRSCQAKRGDAQRGPGAAKALYRQHCYSVCRLDKKQQVLFAVIHTYTLLNAIFSSLISKLQSVSFPRLLVSLPQRDYCYKCTLLSQCLSRVLLLCRLLPVGCFECKSCFLTFKLHVGLKSQHILQ